VRNFASITATGRGWSEADSEELEDPMTSWGANDTFFDDVERDNLEFVQEALPNYLAMHKAYCGFLPENFNGDELGAADARAMELHRLGFLNYSILINALLVQRAADAAGDLTGMLDVYGRTSAFFLRAGAVIDIAVRLEESQARVYNAGQMEDGAGGAPNAAVLRKRLSTVDKYNNFLKHNGLPAVRLVDEGGAQQVQIPAEIPMCGAIWSAQKPNAPLATLLGCYAIEVMAELNRFYGALDAASMTALAGWGLTPRAAPAGIRTVLKQANSGSLAVLDGYQSSTSSSYFLKWG
jgi:hypothetical protein